jgi:hypothetical protein
MKSPMERIRLNCKVCEATGCTEWHGYKLQGTPMMTVGGKRVAVRQVVLKEAGRWRSGHVATNTCQNPDCVGLDHARAWTRTQLQRRTMKNHSYRKSPAHRVALSNAAKRLLTPEAVQALRGGTLTPQEASRLYGCHERTAYKARDGQTWRDYRSPFAGIFAGLMAANDSARKVA